VGVIGRRRWGISRKAGAERREVEARTFVIWEWLVLALEQKAPEVIVGDLVVVSRPSR